MNTKEKTPTSAPASADRQQIILWILAIVIIFAAATLLGWRVFYGYVVPQANNLGTLSTVGLFVFAGIAGLMANFGPCSLAVLPAYMSFYLGMEDTNGGHSPIKRSLKLGLIASLGVVSFFIVLGVLLAVIGTTLTSYVSQLKFVVAALIFLAGISMINGKSMRLPFLERFRNTVSQASEGRSRAIHLFAFGIIYGAGGLMCFLPIFLPLVFFPFVSGAFLISVVSFLIFSLGQALFLTTATVFIGQGKHSYFKPIMARTATMKKVAGWILILTSLWMTAIFFLWGM